MSHEARAWVWECSHAKGVGRFILLAVAEKAPASTCQAYASLSWLQDMANAGRPAVVKALKDLLASSELEVVEGETGPFGAAVYRLPKALGYIPGSAKSVRSQNRSAAAVSGAKPSRPEANGSLTEPIDTDGAADHGADADEIGSLSEPSGFLSGPIEAGSQTEPIGEIGSLTEPVAEGPSSQSVLFDAPIGSVRQPLHKNTTTNRSLKDTRASSTKRNGGSKAPKGDDRTPADAAAFAAFWKAYPKKDSKPAAVKAWNAALERGAKPDVLIAGAEAYRNSPRRSPKYTKNPATWLNNDCWDNEDEPDIAGTNGHQAYLETPGETPDYSSDWFDEDTR